MLEAHAVRSHPFERTLAEHIGPGDLRYLYLLGREDETVMCGVEEMRLTVAFLRVGEESPETIRIICVALPDEVVRHCFLRTAWDRNASCNLEDS